MKDEYELAVVPDGYRELNVAEKINGKMYLYVNDSGQVLQFTYEYGANLSNVFIKTEEYEQSSSFVHGFPADIYIATEEKQTSVIVWKDSDVDVLFYICAEVDENKLIVLAENVQKKE